MVSSKRGFFLLFSLILATLYCENQSSVQLERPAPVSLIPGGPDTSQVEIGIDAIPDGDKIRIEWAIRDPQGHMFYEIYRSSTEIGPFTKVATVSFPDTTYEDPVGLLTRYYYYVLAVNDEDVKSEPSDTLSYKLLYKPEGLSPIGETTPIPRFRWRDPNNPPAHLYIIRVREGDTKRFVWISYVESQYNVEVTTLYNSDQRARLDSLISGKTYEWRVDIVGNEPNCGSESPWTIIRIQ